MSSGWQEGPQDSPGAAAEMPFSQESRVRSLCYACGPGLHWASPQASLVAQLVKNPPAMQEALIDSCIGKIL